MATEAEYTAGTSAALKAIQADIAADVPQMFQHQIPQQLILAHAQKVARVAIDAAAEVRAKAQQSG